MGEKGKRKQTRRFTGLRGKTKLTRKSRLRCPDASTQRKISINLFSFYKGELGLGLGLGELNE